MIVHRRSFRSFILSLQSSEERILLPYRVDSYLSVDKEERESLERAVENGVKRSSARTKEWIGKERRRMNQLISGTVSLDTLRWLFG